MFLMPVKSRQLYCATWSCEQVIHKHAITLGYTLDDSTLQTYNYHLQSCLFFFLQTTLPLDPTPDTLSFYIVFMSHHIKPASVMQYLSGIINSVEPHFPNVRHNILVTRTLAGMRKLRGFTGTHHKRALTEDDFFARSFLQLATSMTY